MSAYRWNDREFATRREVTDAIAAEVAQWLCDGDAGSVTRGEDVFCLEIQIRMRDTDGGENDSRQHVKPARD